MKKTITLSVALGLSLLWLLNSNSSGPAHNGNGNLTGSPGSAGTCTGCHSHSMGTTTLTIEILNKADLSPTLGSYVPHQDYVVRLLGNHGSLNHFGFQLTALQQNQADAGSFSALGTALHQITIGGQTLVEHHHPLSPDPQGEIARFEWTAPGPGVGTITFYGIVNAVNLDNSNTGDAVSDPEMVSLTEASTFISSMDKAPAACSLYPNPARTQLNGEVYSPLQSRQVQIFDLQGQLRHTITLPQGQPSFQLDISQWAPGYYFIQFVTDQGIEKASFLKEG